jgi:hypothetical protein
MAVEHRTNSVAVDPADLVVAIECCELQAQDERNKAYAARGNAFMTGAYEHGEQKFKEHWENSKRIDATTEALREAVNNA